MSFITINSKMFDRNGNYTVTAKDIGAAEAVHHHDEASVIGLSLALSAKSPISHRHAMVTAIKIGESSITSGNVTFIFDGNFSVIIELDGSITVSYATAATNVIKEIRLNQAKTVSLYLTDPITDKRFQISNECAALNGVKGY